MNHCCIFAVLVAVADSAVQAQWQRQTIDTGADFRGLCAVSSRVAWVSGTKGTFGRTTDGGQTWSVGMVAGAEELDFRDVEAFGESTAYLLASGPGDSSRIYKTVDAGKTWSLQFKNTEPEAFFDAIAFWDEQNGIALSDPVTGKFRLVVTDNGGTTWKSIAETSLPSALANEGAFAASGTCLVTRGSNDVWFATGGVTPARVFHSSDRGRNWTVHESPIAAGSASEGIFSMAFRDQNHGMIVGGDYRKPSDAGSNSAVTNDAGKTWVVSDTTIPYRSAIAWAHDRWVAVGTAGTYVSLDNGANWKLIDRENFNSVSFTAAGDGWAAGPKGRIAKFAKP